MTKNLGSNIIDYEQGNLSEKKTIKMFQNLVNSGKAWKLQGHYGRTAQALIDNGWISKEGKVVKYPE
jgi:hypothetical protein